MIKYEKDALTAIQQVYDDPRLETLADRLEEKLTILERKPGDQRVRQGRYHQTRLWRITVVGNGETFNVLWDEVDGPVWVRWAGFGKI